MILTAQRSTLQSFLASSHPNLLVETRFIKQRGDIATITFEQARRLGEPIEQALEMANQILYLNLRFSIYDTIKNILWEEFEGVVRFSRTIPPNWSELQPSCSNIKDPFLGAQGDGNALQT